MAKMVVTGGGLVGLCAAMLLAGDGHDVTVLERDATEPPARPTDAWDGWERRGVNQFHQPHYFLPPFRALLETELPAVPPALAAAGAWRENPLASAPESITGGFRPGDERHEVLTGRRPVVEAVLAGLAAQTPGIAMRRGVAVAGLLTGEPHSSGVPHVTGVRTESGEEIAADVVIDATGRRSPLPAWLSAIGARPPIEELDDSGFIYYGRYFRSADGSVPPAFGPLLQPYGSISILTLPGDNGTWGVGIIASAGDAQLRPLRDTATWMRTVAGFPLIAHWTGGEPLHDDVWMMAKIEDRCRTFVVDGAPVATGVLAVGDSWSCTNPSLGRGASIGLMHAVALRDLLRTEVAEHPVKLALAWHDTTDAVVMPFYRSTVHFDRHRLAEIEAVIRGEPYEPGDPTWELTKALQCAAMRDPECLRAYVALAGVVRRADDIFGEPGFAEHVMRVGGDWRDVDPLGPDRAGLLALIAG